MTLDSAIVILVSILTNLITASTLIRKHYKSVYGYVLIGVVGDVPPLLSEIPVFTSYFKARNASNKRLRILKCSRLSYALRRCDFVVAKEGCDPKLINYSDDAMLKAIITDNAPIMD